MSKRQFRILFPHIVAIGLIMLLPLLIFDLNDDYQLFHLFNYYHNIVLTIVLFYVNYLYITPHFYIMRKKWTFFVAITVFFVLYTVIYNLSYHFLYDFLGFDFLNQEPQMSLYKYAIHPRKIYHIYFTLLIVFVSSVLAIIQHIRSKESLQHDRDLAHREIELSFLKNQVSPHFFFNTLNNIYALIAIDADKAQQSIEKLSNLMRYLIYDSDSSRIHLSKELAFNRNYIELMRQRLNSKVKLDVAICECSQDIEVYPLLFISFIENAFKHGISYRGSSFINIKIDIKDGDIVFECINSISNQKQVDSHGGVGIANIKRRLDLLYGNKVKLEMFSNQSIYSVTLQLPLDM